MNMLKEFFGATPIWNNPIGWARKVGQSRSKVIIWTFIHLAFVAFGLWSIYFLVGKIPTNDFSGQSANKLNLILAMTPGIGTMIFIGAFFPACYLFVIHRLLQEIEKRDGTNAPLK